MTDEKNSINTDKLREKGLLLIYVRLSMEKYGCVVLDAKRGFPLLQEMLGD